MFALDATYILMARGFVDLTAVVDWASREILAHRVAITRETAHTIEALEEAFARYGLPDIVNADQGRPIHRGRVHQRGAQSPYPSVDERQGRRSPLLHRDPPPLARFVVRPMPRTQARISTR